MSQTVDQQLKVLSDLARREARKPFLIGWATEVGSFEALLRAVQALPSVHDPSATEWQPTAEWTVQHGGDADDRCVLLAAALLATGHIHQAELELARTREQAERWQAAHDAQHDHMRELEDRMEHARELALELPELVGQPPAPGRAARIQPAKAIARAAELVNMLDRRGV